MGVLKNAPLIYTLSAVRFPTIPSIDTFIPAIIEALRQKYPDFNSTDTIGVTINPEKDGASVQTQQSRQWYFNDVEGKWGFIIQPNLLLYHTIDYEHFREFGERMLEALNVVTEIAKLSHYQSLGIRYIDLIEPQSDMNLSDYLKPELLTFKLQKIHSEWSDSVMQHRYGTEFGHLLLKCHVLNRGGCLPNDLMSAASLLRLKHRTIESRYAILDTDHVHQEVVSTGLQLFALDPPEIIAKLDTMHHQATAAFEEAVTPQALIAWNKDNE